MRTILFRGKRVDNGDWVEGFYIQIMSFGNEYHCIFEAPNIDSFNDLNDYKVIPETVGQFTGLLDKNGAKIFEGDIVSAWSEGYNHIGEIRWRFEGQPAIIIYPAFANQGFWKLHGNRNNGDAFSDGKIDDGVEVIGNIHDDPF